MNSSKITFYSFAFVFIACVTVDQLFKYWAGLRHIVQYNSGISMSWLPGMNQLTVSILLLVFLAAIAWSWRTVWLQYSGWSALFFGGAVSNIIDRLLYNGVRDWMSLPGLNLKNNLADWFVCIGLAAILFQVISQKKNHE